MRPQTKAIDVIMERVPLANRWISERWQPAAVEIVERRADAPVPRDLVPGTCEMMPADAKLAVAVAGPPADRVPAHPRLRALGRVEDVASLLQSVDFLINVNRFTLFDLSTIEATQAGKALLLHAVGGNRAFERLGAGCVMLSDLEPSTVARGLTAMATLDSSSLGALAERSRSCWQEHLTPRHMWERHLALYDEVA